MASTPVNALEFFDNLERYADKQGVANDGTYSLVFPEWDENQGGPYATSGNLGVVPFSGNRMMEIRTASIGRPNIMRAPAIRGLGEFPGWEVSVKVLASSTEFAGQGFGLGIFNEGRVYKLDIDFATGFCEMFPGGTKVIPNIRDRWIEAKLRFDKESRNLTAFVDNQLIGSQTLIGLFAGVSSVSFGVGQGKDLTAKYPRSQGAPGVFVDNYRITSVADPASMTGLLLGTLASAVRKKK